MNSHEGRCLAINQRWSSPSRVTLAFQRYLKYHTAEPRHTLSVLSFMSPAKVW